MTRGYADTPRIPGDRDSVDHVRPRHLTLVRLGMTRFDRLWEPLLVVVAALVILIRSL